MSDGEHPDLFLMKREVTAVEIEELEVDASGIEYINESVTSADKNGNSLDSVNKKKFPVFKKYLQYKKCWEKDFLWITQRNNRAYCIVCDKSLTNHTGHLKRHENRKGHQSNLRHKRSQIDFLKKKWKKFKENHQEELESHYNDLKTIPTAINKDESASDCIDFEMVTVPGKDSSLELDVQCEFPRRRGRPRKKAAPETTQYIEIEREKPAPTKADETRYDDNFNFLMSFLNHMKRMPLEKNLRFRADMSRLLVEVFESDNSASTSTSMPISSSRL